MTNRTLDILTNNHVSIDPVKAPLLDVILVGADRPEAGSVHAATEVP